MRLLRPVSLVAFFATVGCGPSLRQSPAPLDSLLSAYRLKNEQLQRATEERGLVVLSVDTVGPAALVSLRVQDAPLAVVLRGVLEASNRPYVYHGVRPAGTVTASFGGVPLLPALNLLLVGHGYSAAMRQGIISIHERAVPEDTASGTMPRDSTSSAPDSTAQQESTAATTHAEVPLQHLGAEAADSMLDRLYPQEGRNGLHHSAHPARSSVLLRGAPPTVRAATALLRRADQAPPHVLLEALVVEFDRNSLLELGIDITKASTGKFRDIFLRYGTGDAKRLGLQWADSLSLPGSVSALVQALAATDRARVIARPYVSTRSGDTARVRIARDRYVLVPSGEAGPYFLGQTAITAGVLLQMRPTVMPDGEVRVEVHVEESQFLPQLSPASVEVDRNKASTTMQVASGQTIVIGGLALDRQSQSNRGFPGLRRIPILNLLFAQQRKRGEDQEVVIFVTPYVWEPGMDAPVPFPGEQRD